MAALTFPLSLAQFWEKLPIDDFSMEIGEALEISQLGGGGILTADLGERLWAGRVRLGRVTYDEAAEVEGLISLLRAGKRTFQAYDIRRPECRAGALPPGFEPKVGPSGVTARTLSLVDLPAEFVISPGDHLGLGGMLHRVVQGGTVAPGGIPEIEVTPEILPGPVAGDPVTLSRASIEAMIVPGSFEPGASRRHVLDGLSFSFIEVW